MGVEATVDVGGRRPHLVASDADAVVLQDAVVVTRARSAPLSGAEVAIRGDRIVHVGPKGSFVGPEAVRLSLRDRWLLPGLIDCHVHLVGSGVGREAFGRYLERDADVRILRIAADAARFLAAGVTTVRHLGHGDPRHVRELQHAAAAGTVLAPDVLSCGWAVSQSGGHGDLPDWPFALVEDLSPSAAFCDGAAGLRAFVRHQAELGASWIKVFATQGVISTPDRFADLPNFTLAELEAVVEEAHDAGLGVAAHATGVEGALRAVRAGVDTLEHGPSVVSAELVTEAASTGVSVVPTLSVTAWAARAGGGHGLPGWAAARAERTHDGRAASSRALAEAGVPVAVGSDSGTRPRLFGTGEEIECLDAAGFDGAATLGMATEDAARALGMEPEIGSIEVGKRADLVVLDADPMQRGVLGVASHVDTVVVRGTVLRWTSLP